MLPSPLRRLLILTLPLVLLGPGCEQPTVDDDDTAGNDDDDTTGDDDDDITGDDDDDITGDDDDTTPGGDYEVFLDLLDTLPSAGTTAEQRTQAEDFLIQIHYSGGFPIHHGDTATFCALLDTEPAGGLSLDGDHSGWVPSPMQRAADIPFYWITIEVSDPIPRWKYKFVHHEAQGDEWAADPWSRRYGYDPYGEHSLVSGDASESHLERYRQFEANQLGNERTVRLYIPQGYDPASPLPVLYMHDGQNLFDPTAAFGEWEVDETLDDLVSSGAVRPVFVVGLDNTAARMDEYTHVPDDFGHGIMGGDSAAYADLLVNQVIPFVDARYATATGPANTGMLGSSLGGLVSFDIALQHPGVFGAVGGMSSTLGWGAYSDLGETMIERWAAAGHQGMTLYLDSGGGVHGACQDHDGDGIHEDSNDADNYCVTLQMAATLEAIGYTYDTDLFHWWEPWATHSEPAWAQRLPLFLETVFPGP